MTILIIDNYDSFTFNLYQAFQSQTDQKVEVRRNDKITMAEIAELKPTGIVLSPGPGHPSVDKDFGVCKNVIASAAQMKIPVFGVCLGHQGMAEHLGGKVERAPEIVHGKTSTVVIEQTSRIFDGLPQQFQAMRYHSFVVNEQELPSCLKVTAREAKNKLIMALEHRVLPMFGVQFHPESIGTPEGNKIVRNFIELC